MVNSAVLYRGELVVAGYIRMAGDPPGWTTLPGFARWDGHRWQTVGEGVSWPKMVEVVGEDLIAGGELTGWSDEGSLVGVARWDGSKWHRMGQGLLGTVFAVAEFEGRVYAGGENLTVVATNERTTVAVFDGTEWSVVPNAPKTARWNAPRVRAFEVNGGRLYVGGNFVGSQDVASQGVVAWDGRQWIAVGAGVPRGEVEDLVIYRGDLYAGGLLGGDGSAFESLWRWNGSTWSSLGLGYCQVTALGVYGEKLVVAGNAGGRSVRSRLARHRELGRPAMGRIRRGRQRNHLCNPAGGRRPLRRGLHVLCRRLLLVGIARWGGSELPRLRIRGRRRRRVRPR